MEWFYVLTIRTDQVGVGTNSSFSGVASSDTVMDVYLSALADARKVTGTDKFSITFWSCQPNRRPA